MKNLSYLLTVFLFFNSNAQEVITVQANQQLDTSTKFMQGFLHGGPTTYTAVSSNPKDRHELKMETN